MKNQKRGWSIPRPVAIRGAWLCVGSLIALFVLMVTDTQQDVRPAQVVVMLAALFGVALFIGNWVNTTQQGIIYGHKQLLNLRSPMWPTYHFYGGTPRQYLDFFRHDTGPETIALVAWTHKNGNIYAVERPGRHGHVIAMLAEMDLAGAENLLDDGFVTSHGRYVNRKEAVIIATSQGQTVRKTSPVSELFSEDLWYTPKEMRDAAYPGDKLDKDNPRSIILSTLPSLAYLHDESIQISEAELAAENSARIKPVAYTRSEDDPNSFVGIVAQEVAQIAEIAVEPAPQPDGILSFEQAKALLAEGRALFRAEVEKALEIPGFLLPNQHMREMATGDGRHYPDWPEPRDLQDFISQLRHLADLSNDLRILLAQWRLNHTEDKERERSDVILRTMRQLRGEDIGANCGVIQRLVERLIHFAVDEGVVVTIHLEPMDPQAPAMGKYYMIPEVREAYGIYAPRLLLQQELKSKES